jgi:DNA-binding transcriptional LysR family regulator
MNVSSLDLNLLTVFDAVWRLKSVSRAAAEIGLSQPAASNGLRRLREHFRDRLFVRIADGMLPTPVAKELGPVISDALSRIHVSLRRRRDFVPRVEQRTFTIIMTDIGEIVFLPSLLRYIKDHAPGISVRTAQLSSDKTRLALESGDVDLAIGYIPQIKSGLYQQRLFNTEYVCIVRKDHPAIGAMLTRKQFLTATHAVADAAGTGHHIVEKQLERLGIHRRIGLWVPNFLALPMIVASTDMIATVPEPLGAAFVKTENIKLIPLPISFPRLTIKQFWHERYHDDPASRWLRQSVTALFQTGIKPVRFARS